VKRPAEASATGVCNGLYQRIIIALNAPIIPDNKKPENCFQIPGSGLDAKFFIY